MVEFSFDFDDFERQRDYDSRREERREQDRIDEMQRNDAFEAFLRDAERDRMQEAVREVVNNPAIVITEPMMKAINDPTIMMEPSGKITRTRKRATISGRDRIRRSGQFSRSNLLPNLPMKRTRKKTKMDKTMSKCLKIANKKFRKANGQLRKGKTMRDIMRYAHRLCKKES